MKKPSKRVLDILAGMSVEEKVGQLSCIMPILVMKGGKVSQEKMDAVIPRSIGRMTQFSTGFLAGPRAAAEGYNEIQRHALEKQPSKVPVMVQNESAAGLMAAGATVFPVPVAVASSWQPELAGDMGRIIREEGKAIGVHVAMSPVADVARDSRWGRVSETFGEDPMLAARFSAEKAKGIQGEDYRENILSMAKHFMGYGMSEVGVNAAVIPMGKKELFEVYGTLFAAAIKEADMQSVMVTYSEIDGLPMSVNEHYMRKVLREDMGFNGVAVCDGGSIPRVQQQQGLYHSLEELAGRALRAGIDADTPFTMVYTSIKSGIEKGLVDEKDLDESVLRILTHKEELGLLDDPFVDPEEAARIYARPDGRRVSEEIAQKEITLLKNKDKLLPLKKDTKKLALIGPFGGRLSTLFGGYAYPSMLEMFIGACLGVYGHMMEGFAELFGEILDKEDIIRTLGLDLDKSYEENLDGFIRRAYDTKTLKEAMGDAMPDCDIAFHRGVGTGEDWKQEIGEAVAAARDSEVILVAVGEVTGFGAGATSGEGVNNPDLRLPGHQQQLLEALAELGKPIVMVLFNGRALKER